MSGYSVFLSYKSSDLAIAEAFRNQIAPFAPDLDFFFAPARVTAGEPWRDRLLEELRKADSLFLIYTPAFQYDDDDTRTNDWLLYEAGLKCTLDADPDPVICFYPQGQRVPKPVEHLQGVEASRESLRSFVDQFLRTPQITRRERALNPNLDDARLDQIADELSGAFRIATTQRRYPTYRLSVTLPETLTITADSAERAIPGAALASGDLASLDIFGRVDTCTWEELTREQREHGARWVSDLDTAFDAVLRGRRPPPATGTFRDESGRILRPTLYRADWSGDAIVGVRIILTEEQAPAYFGGPLFNILRLTERYKDEVFGVYLDSLLLEARREPARLPRVLHKLRATLRAIDDDHRGSNALSREGINHSFPDDDDRRSLMSLRSEWYDRYNELWAQLNSTDEQPLGDGVEATLTELRRNIDETSAIAARRYAQLVGASRNAANR